MKGPKLAVLLGVGAVAVGFQNYVFFSSRPAPPVRIYEPAEVDTPTARSGEERGVEELDLPAVTRWLSSQPGADRSPFLTEAESRERWGAGPVVSTAGAPRLSGTLWSEGRRVAWIDGRPHSEGDFVGQSRIVRIEPEEVLLERAGERIPLRIRRAPTGALPLEEASDDD